MAKRPVEKYDFKAFGEAIKEARKGRKESRKKVSDEMYISPRYLANIENNGQHPSLQIFFELIMENMLAFHPCGVCPTSAAIVPTFSFTSPNIVDRFPLMAPIRISFIHSLIASSMLCISLYPRFLTEQAGKQRYKGHADKGNAAARHKLLHALAFC